MNVWVTDTEALVTASPASLDHRSRWHAPELPTSRDEIGRLRRQLAVDQLDDLVRPDRKLVALEAELRGWVKRTPTRLPNLYGVGPWLPRLCSARTETSLASGTASWSLTRLSWTQEGNWGRLFHQRDRPTPTTGSSDKPQPGPDTDNTPLAATA